MSAKKPNYFSLARSYGVKSAYTICKQPDCFNRVFDCMLKFIYRSPGLINYYYFPILYNFKLEDYVQIIVYLKLRIVLYSWLMITTLIPCVHSIQP